jgi:hypothetical protein
MMAKRGYVPSKQRNPDFYGHLRDVLNDNPVPIAVIGYQMAKIKYQPGHFEGKEIPEEQQLVYTFVENGLKREREAKKQVIHDLRLRAFKEKLKRLIGKDGDEKKAA